MEGPGDDARIERNNLFTLTLMEVGEVDGGSTGCTGGAEGSQEGMLKCIPIIPVDAAAFESIKPAESV
jgi:hypothetical protein